MFLFTPDYPAEAAGVAQALRAGLARAAQTLARTAASRARSLTFLLANMIYTDGLVSLFAFGGIYAAGTFGWDTIQIGMFGIIAGDRRHVRRLARRQARRPARAEAGDRRQPDDAVARP